MTSGFQSRVQRFAVLPLVLFSFALGACDDDDSSGPDTVEWQAELTGTDEFEDVEGDAAVISTTSSFDATIEIRNAPADTTFIWNVALGTCAQPGTAIGAASSYADLDVAANGTAEAEADVTTGLNPSTPYIVQVIDDNGEEPVTVACGVLVKED